MKKLLTLLAAALMLTACDKEPVVVASVTLNLTTTTIEVGKTQQITATILPSDASNRSVSWESSNPSVARVSTTGLVTAVAKGDATITVTTADGGKTAQCTVAVVQTATGVSLSESVLSLSPGEKHTLDATVLPENTNNQNISWKSDDEAIATVDPATGEVTAISPGRTIITVTTEDGGRQATCTVLVGLEPDPENILTLIPDPAFREYSTTIGMSLGFVPLRGSAGILDLNGNDYRPVPWDTNSDGKLSPAEAAAVDIIYLRSEVEWDNGRLIGLGDIVSLEGIEYFTGLEYLDCNGNQLSTLDVSDNSSLITLNCGVNPLSTINISKNTALQTLSCQYTQLNTLDISNNGALINLSLSDNNLTSLDLSNNGALKSLYLGYNNLTSLDLSKTIELAFLDCSNNQLTSLDISNCDMLYSMSCSNNPGYGGKFTVTARFDNSAIPEGFTKDSWLFDGNPVAIEYVIVYSPLGLRANKTKIYADGMDEIRFTVMQGNFDVTNFVQVCMPTGQCLLKPVFTTTTPGTYEFYAAYASAPDNKSNTVTIEVVPAVTDSGFDPAKALQKNVTYFTFTATWCGPCYSFKQEMKTFLGRYGSNASVVNLYHSNSEPEVDASDFINPFTQQLGSAGLQMNSVPTTYVDLSSTIVGSSGHGNNYINHILAPFRNSMESAAQTGIRVESFLEGGKVNVSVSAGAKAAGTYRIGVFLTEDNIVCYQNGGGNNYNHTDVFRQSASIDIFGDELPTMNAGDVKSVNYSFDIHASYNPDNLSLVVYTLRESGGKWIVDNSVKAPVGSLMPFRYNVE